VTSDTPWITHPLLQAILDQYQLRPSGPHGILHWGRVLENGRRLAQSTGANRGVVEFFAVFHDACRENDDHDPLHGPRGADLAASLRGGVFDLPDEDLALLCEACAGHTSGRTHADITVQTCWDSDRLDLGRVGITPDPRYLCTATAKERETIAWAHERAWREAAPKLVAREWQMDSGGNFLR
jgi:uncharacterized protein